MTRKKQKEQKVPTMAKSPEGYLPCGNLREAWGTRHRNMMIGGPYGTGKTRFGFERFNLYMCTFPNSVGVIARKTYDDLVPLLDVIFDGYVLGFDPKDEDMPIRRIGGKKPYRYEYWNGSHFDVLGLNNLDGVRGNEWHVGYITQAEECLVDDWAEVSGRLRRPGAPFYQMFGDCNPDVPDHWIREGETAESLTYIKTEHTDNPLIYDPETMNLTEYGDSYLSGLRRLPGIRRERGYEGKWCGSEGQVYDFRKEVHVIPSCPIPKHWRRICGVDWGMSAPAVCLWLAVDPHDLDVHVYRQIYKSQMTSDELAQQIKDINQASGDHVESYQCDPEHPEGIKQFKRFGLNAVPANNDVLARIDAVTNRLRIQERTGKPRLFVHQDTLVEKDPILVLNHDPTELIREFPHYQFDNSGKGRGHHHAQDALGYAILAIDGVVATPLLMSVVDHNMRGS